MNAYEMIIAYEVTKHKQREDKRYEKNVNFNYEC